MNPLVKIQFEWNKLSNKEKRIILDAMKKEDIEKIKQLKEQFDATVILVEILE